MKIKHSMKSVSIKVNDPWESLKKFTPARIAIGRVGSSIPLKQALELKLHMLMQEMQYILY